MSQSTEDGESPSDGVAARREPLMRQGLPAGEGRDPSGIQQAAQDALKIFGFASGGRDDEQTPRQVTGQARHRKLPRARRGRGVDGLSITSGGTECLGGAGAEPSRGREDCRTFGKVDLSSGNHGPKA